MYRTEYTEYKSNWTNLNKMKDYQWIVNVNVPIAMLYIGFTKYYHWELGKIFIGVVLFLTNDATLFSRILVKI